MKNKGKLPAENTKKPKKTSPASTKPSGAGSSGKGKPSSPPAKAESSTAKRKGPEGDASGKKRRRGAWSAEQEAMLEAAVKKLGVGKWKQMVAEFNFDGKESHMLKDKWRRMEAKKAQREGN